MKPHSGLDLQNSNRLYIIGEAEEDGALFCGSFVFPVKYDAVNTDAPVFCISVDTFHTVVTDLFRIKIAAVTFTAADTFPVI